MLLGYTVLHMSTSNVQLTEIALTHRDIPVQGSIRMISQVCHFSCSIHIEAIRCILYSPLYQLSPKRMRLLTILCSSDG